MANSFEELMRNIKKQVQDVAQKEVKKQIKDTMEKHIDSDVYEAYSPTQYERRYENDGLADPNNININVQNIGNGVNITTTDITKANGDDLGEILTPYIEEGIYNWSHKPPKRKFIENTAEDLKQNNLIEQALKQGLKKRGIDTK